MGNSFSVEKIPDLSGKTAVITGCNTGIGRVCAKEMAAKGCRVIMANRSKDRTLPVIEELKKLKPDAVIEFVECDLSDLKNVDNAAKQITELCKDSGIHILLNNAGVMACPFTLTKDGLELQLGTNHVGHFHFTSILFPLLVKASSKESPARLVQVSSMAHKFTSSAGIKLDYHKSPNAKEYSPWDAYGQSKLANILFVRHLNKLCKDKGIDNVYCNAIHPGVVDTELQRNIKDIYFAGAEYVAKLVTAIAAKTPENGALTSLYAATSPEIIEKGYKGEYFVPTGALAQTSSQGKDMAMAEKLWTFSEEIIKEKVGENVDFFRKL